MLRWRSLRRTRYVCENCVRGMNSSQVIALASTIEEVLRAVRVETWQSWLLASKHENVVNADKPFNAVRARTTLFLFF